MKEIKFRVWDKKKEMWSNYQIVDNMIYFMDKVTGVWIRDNKYPDRFKLMQYTGLKDKNEKEIYEGDIIKNNFEETVGSIMFADCGYWIKTIDKDIFNDTIYHVLGQYDGEVLEVIGNIYENPELLEVEDND